MGTRKKLRILASWSSAAQVQMLDGIEVGIFAPAVLDQHQRAPIEPDKPPLSLDTRCAGSSVQI